MMPVVTLVKRSLDATGEGVAVLVVLPSPSCANPFDSQQSDTPSIVTAHEEVALIETSRSGGSPLRSEERRVGKEC